jgi:ribosome-binding protein aMBF1 (putative translation factor)
MSERTNWKSVPRPDAGRVRDIVEDEARVAAFRELVYQLRVDAGLTQVELARRMGTTQSAIVRMENGGTRPT